jgi:RHS repeat-associated protein
MTIGKPIGEFDQWGNFQAWNVYGAGTDEILLRSKDKYGYTIFLLDRRGNVAFLVDNDGALLEKYTCDVFGRPTITRMETGQTLSSTWYSHDFLFQGREYIWQLGIYDYRNRFYLSATGRFLQTDPKGFDAGDMNLFRYCGDDPIAKRGGY